MKAEITSLEVKLINEKNVVLLKNNEQNPAKIENERLKIETQEVDIELNKVTKEMAQKTEIIETTIAENGTLNEKLKSVLRDLN